ncbi:ATP-binding protein, partial [Streptomyces sp. NPDC020766]
MSVTLIKTPQDDEQSPVKQRERRRTRFRTAARAALADDRIRTAGRLVVRHTSYVAGGTRVVVRRAWDGRSVSRYERMIRAAEAAGLMEEVKEWEARGHMFRTARHRRRMDTMQAMLAAPKAIVSALIAGTGLLLFVGILLAWANNDVRDVLTPIETVVDL